ncbi:hypothetical protein AMTRI_Chr09g19810 [Amborella trichopoda]
MDHSDNCPGNNNNSGSGSGTKSGYMCRQSNSRWIPTAEQIRILRELYYSNGVRSPTAEQIQRISARLRQYGKIEGKNVFYWFQNHKARERQKKRLTVDLAVQRAAATSGGLPPGVLNVSHIAGSTCGSVLMESSLMDCCSTSALENHNGRKERENGDLIVERERSAPGKETLQLFPMHHSPQNDDTIADDYFFNDEEEKPVCMASLELTLNSFDRVYHTDSDFRSHSS